MHDDVMSLEVVSELTSCNHKSKDIFFQWRVSGFGCLQNITNIIYWVKNFLTFGAKDNAEYERGYEHI